MIAHGLPKDVLTDAAAFGQVTDASDNGTLVDVEAGAVGVEGVHAGPPRGAASAAR